MMKKALPKGKARYYTFTSLEHFLLVTDNYKLLGIIQCQITDLDDNIPYFLQTKRTEFDASEPILWVSGTSRDYYITKGA